MPLSFCFVCEMLSTTVLFCHGTRVGDSPKMLLGMPISCILMREVFGAFELFGNGTGVSRSHVHSICMRLSILLVPESFVTMDFFSQRTGMSTGVLSVLLVYMPAYSLAMAEPLCASKVFCQRTGKFFTEMLNFQMFLQY